VSAAGESLANGWWVGTGYGRCVGWSVELSVTVLAEPLNYPYGGTIDMGGTCHFCRMQNN